MNLSVIHQVDHHKASIYNTVGNLPENLQPGEQNIRTARNLLVLVYKQTKGPSYLTLFVLHQLKPSM